MPEGYGRDRRDGIPLSSGLLLCFAIRLTRATACSGVWRHNIDIDSITQIDFHFFDPRSRCPIEHLSVTCLRDFSWVPGICPGIRPTARRNGLSPPMTRTFPALPSRRTFPALTRTRPSTDPFQDGAFPSSNVFKPPFPYPRLPYQPLEVTGYGRSGDCPASRI